jgi:DNA helicase II / ATP-dependent DNA helicase PcrA
MRMPNSKEMSKEQKNIYLDAPLDGIILVTGPPGTGKTVIAFLRAKTINDFEIESTVVMYNNVLSSFTSNIANDEFVVSTFHKWIFNWWNKIGASGESDDTGKVYLNCPYDEKDKAKSLGARWDRVKKKWYVFDDVYQQNVKAFQRWNPSSGYMELPTLDGDKWLHDWNKIQDVIVSGVSVDDIAEEDVNWGHLILDEGQDFSPDMFETLYLIRMLVFKKYSEENMPSLTIFADDNQRLSDKTNSRIIDIANNLHVDKDRKFLLKKNYRNTLQIAYLARTFYTGLKTGMPDLPEKQGELPLLFTGDNINNSVDYICRYAQNHENEEIGILVQNNYVRKKLINKISHRLNSNSRLTVQSYAANDPSWKNAGNMKFDAPGVITIVNKQSCKGLEFDAVFLPELQSVSVDPSDKDSFMMEMYVMVSRARSKLVLMLSNEGEEDPAVISFLPDSNSGLLEYING